MQNYASANSTSSSYRTQMNHVIQGVHMSNNGYGTALFKRNGTSKNYIMVPTEPYGSFSIKAAVRGPYMQPESATPGGNCRCGNGCGCNCAHGGGCNCPYLNGVN